MDETNLKLVKEMFELKLNNLNEKLDAHNQNILEKIESYNKYQSAMLSVIDNKVTKTNGNVIRHEQDIKELVARYNAHLLTSATVEQIEEIEEKIEKLNEENFIIKVLNRYPKAFAIVVIVILLSTIGSLGFSMIKFHAVINDIQKTELTK